MVLQQIRWPEDGMCTEKELYYHTNLVDNNKISTIEADAWDKQIRERTNLELLNAEKVHLAQDAGIVLEKHAKVSLDTYFNGFYVEKWKKYTTVQQISVKLEYKGNLIIRLCSKQMLHNEIIKKIIINKEVHTAEKTSIMLTFENADKGMLYVEIEALSDDSCFYGGYFYDNTIKEPQKQVKIGVDICTFKREGYVCHNLELLNERILNNPSSPLYRRLEVFVSDNGKTLDIEKLSTEHIHLVQNKNTGGAGGFTRGLIEMINGGNPYGITHPLIMDDDIVIDTEAIVRTYTVLSLLKDEYKDAFIGGAMLRIDKQYIQVESGASWNAGNLISNKSGLDMRNCWDCLFNEVEEFAEYNAWWYCCFPIDVVREDNLPLPIFIRGDDLEYGIRNMKHMILMNGICVWHEPFENKYSSFLEYYIIRNRLIDNTYHFPNWGKAQLKKAVWGQWRRECKFYRYKNVDLHTQGVRDYLKGIDFLLETDGETLHKEVMAAGYKAVPVDQLDVPFFYSIYDGSRHMRPTRIQNLVRKLTFNGYFLPAKHIRIVSMAQATIPSVWRAKRVMYYDVTANKGFVCDRSFKKMVSKFFMVLGLTIQIDFKYNKAKKSYLKRANEIRNIEFWKKYLKIN